jgi:hypothetical protein
LLLFVVGTKANLHANLLNLLVTEVDIKHCPQPLKVEMAVWVWSYDSPSYTQLFFYRINRFADVGYVKPNSSGAFVLLLLVDFQSVNTKLCYAVNCSETPACQIS